MIWQYGVVIYNQKIKIFVQKKMCAKFEGEEWYDQRDVFQVNREEAHTSFTSFNALEYTHSYSVALKPVSTSDMDASMEKSKVVLP